MNAKPALILVWLAVTTFATAQTILDFAATNEGFSNTGIAGGATIRATDTGGGSLLLTNPAAWTWRANSTFSKTGTGKSKEIALALGSAGQSGGYLHFDIILRPSTAATGTTGSFWGAQYTVAINQEIPGGANGWVQTIAYSRPSSGFLPAAETVIPVSVPLSTWASPTSDLHLHPDSSSYQITLGSNSGGVTQLEWHVDNLRIEVLPSVPGVIQLEAESAALTGVSVANSTSGFNGTGYVNGFDQPGDKLIWTINSTGGFYRLLIRYRTPAGMKGFSGNLNGGGFSGYFPANNSFAVYDAGLVELAAGSNVLTIGGGWNFYEIDSATLTPESPPPPPSPGPAIPVDPLATVATRALLTAIASDYGTTTYSGQHEADDLSVIRNGSGKLPAIFAGDLINYSPTRVEHGSLPTNYTESIITKAAEGHICSVIWHWNAPSGILNTAEQPWWTGFYTAGTTFDVSAALANPGSTDHALLLRDIDAIAVQLRKLSQANIPILWRPLHEAEGGWFWWGAKGPDAYKQLWRLLFTRLTEYHHLHNLIWVLTVEDPAWYPGNDVVDVIGVDAYPDDRTDALLTRWQPLRARFDGVKPIALTEFGGIPDIEKMQRYGVWWAWFASWQGTANGPQSAPAATLQRIYQSPGVITRDELPPPADSNADGVLDTEATSMGFTAAQDLTPAILFFRQNAGRFAIGHSPAELAAATQAGRDEILANPSAHGLFTSSQLHAIAPGQPLLARDPASGLFTMKLSLLHSADLTSWNAIAPSGVRLQPGGSVELDLPASGNAAFYRVQGQAP